MAACCPSLSRQLLIAMLRFYVFIGFICHVLVDGRMRLCNEYFCAGGNFGLVGDGDKRSFDDFVVRRDFATDRPRDSAAVDRDDSLLTVEPLPIFDLAKPEVADDGDIVRLRSLLVRLAALQQTTDFETDVPDPSRRRHRQQQQQQPDFGDTDSRRKHNMLKAWLEHNE